MNIALGLTSSSSSWAAFIVELPIFFAFDSSNAQKPWTHVAPSWPSGWFKSDHKKSSASDCRAWISMFFVDLLQGLGHVQWSEPKLSQSWQKVNILARPLFSSHVFQQHLVPSVPSPVQMYEVHVVDTMETGVLNLWMWIHYVKTPYLPMLCLLVFSFHNQIEKQNANCKPQGWKTPTATTCTTSSGMFSTRPVTLIRSWRHIDAVEDLPSKIARPASFLPFAVKNSMMWPKAAIFGLAQ